jgi:hypothetical protein
VALAHWIIDPDNPLTWRSVVNRVWQHHFGRGIVDSPNDFGRMGSLPSHPGLLDWLARTFRDSGGSFKGLHRLLVSSAVYRQASRLPDGLEEADPDNRWLCRSKLRRLDAEEIHDAALLAAGMLDRTMYGPPYATYLFTDDHSPRYEYERVDWDDPAVHRRAIYRSIVRSVPDPFFQSLDCADPSQLVAQRTETHTALQALTLWNHPFALRMSERIAARAARESADDGVGRAMELLLGRRPCPEERTVLEELAREHGLVQSCRVLLNSNEFLFVD